MSKYMALAVFALLILSGCGKDLTVLGELKGGTFYVIRPAMTKPMYGKAFELFVDELIKAGAMETQKCENADFNLFAGDVRIYLSHRREGGIWSQPWPSDNKVGFMENAREDAAEFRDFLARKDEDPPDSDR